MTARKPGGSDHSTGTSGNGKTAQSYIAGIGASGALLAGAVVTFVFLVGTVSFSVWPVAAERNGTESLGVAELSGPGSGSSAATLGETVTLLAATVPSVDADAVLKADGGLKGRGDGSGSESDEGVGGGTGGGSDGSGTAGGDPGGDPGPSEPDNDEGDRPSSSNPRPDRGQNNQSNGSSGSSTASGPSTGSTQGSSRPSAGGGTARGR